MPHAMARLVVAYSCSVCGSAHTRHFDMHIIMIEYKVQACGPVGRATPPGMYLPRRSLPNLVEDRCLIW